MKSGPRLYYGWYMLGAVAGSNFANTATTIGVRTVVVLSLSDEFGWTRMQISTATSIGAILEALASPFIGRVTDRVEARIPLTLWGAHVDGEAQLRRFR